MPRFGLEMKKGVLILIWKSKLLNHFRKPIKKYLVKADPSTVIQQCQPEIYILEKWMHVHNITISNIGETIDIEVLRGAQRREEL